MGWIAAVVSACDLVPVERCETPSGFCEAAGLRIVQPAPGPVGPKVEVTVESAFRSPEAAPATVTVHVGDAPPLTLSRRADGTYTGTWEPQAPGAVTLVASSGDISSPPVQVTVDLQGPLFSISAPTPARTESSDFTDKDGDHWKRDERVTVTVQSSVDVVPGTVTYRLQGLVEGSGGPLTAPKPVSGSIAGGAYNGTIEVDLSEPEFNGFRGSVSVVVDGRDNAGNAGSGSRAIPVSRLKWIRTLGASGTQVEPAIADGALWTGLRGSSGALYRLEQDGGMNSFLAPGLVGGLMVAQLPENGDAGVYFTVTTDAGTVAADAGYLRVAASSSGEIQTLAGPYGGGMARQLALLKGEFPTGNPDRHTVVAGTYEGNGSLIGVTVAGGPLEVRTPWVLASPPVAGSWGAQGPSVYFQQAGSSTEVRFGSANWSVGRLFPSTDFAAIAPDRSQLWGAGRASADGGVFVYDTTSGAPLASVPSGTSAATPLSMDGLGQVYFGDADGGLLQADESGLIARVALDVRTAPVVGAQQFVYAVAQDGVLVAYDLDLAAKWRSEPLGSNPQTMLLDCQRGSAGAAIPGAMTGVLYLPVGTKVIAVIVDSAGLANTPWPRGAHDNANTANRDTPIALCP